MKNFKSISGKMTTFWKKHGPAIMVGIQALRDEAIRETLMKKMFEADKGRDLYEQALDYASK